MTEQVDRYIEIWKKTIEVQQHFNDIEMKVRNLAVIVLVAIMSAVGFVIDKKINIQSADFDLRLDVCLLFVSLVTWILFWGTDKYWYHRLLLGAVKHGAAIEGEIRKLGVEVSLTKKIGDESPVPMFCKNIHSTDKIDIFYWSIASLISLLIIFIMFGLSTSIPALVITIFLWGVWLIFRRDRDEEIKKKKE